jgi:hypothetical protein
MPSTPDPFVILQHILLRLPLLHHLVNLGRPLLPQRNEHPEPRRHLHKPPRKHQAIMQTRIARAHHVIIAARRHHAAFLRHVRVRCEREEEEKPHGGLQAPVFIGQFFGHGDCGQVGEPNEGEEDGEEGDGSGGGEEFAGSGLRMQLADVLRI